MNNINNIMNTRKLAIALAATVMIMGCTNQKPETSAG